MKPRLLFPQKFRYLGFLLAIPGFVLGWYTQTKNYEISGFTLNIHDPNIMLTGNAAHDKEMLSYGLQPENYTNELALTLVIVGLIFIAFAKLKREDELTTKVRINALYWAILINYLLYTLLIIVAIICHYLQINIGGGIFGPYAYIIAFSTYNLFSPLVIFVTIYC